MPHAVLSQLDGLWPRHFLLLTAFSLSVLFQMSKSTEEAMVAAKSYLQSTNRPYSANDIFNNLQNKFSKAAIVKALDTLVATNEVCERINGKQKIYFLSQEHFEIDNEKLKELDNKAEQATVEISKFKEAIVLKEQKIKVFKEHVPIENYEEQLESLKEEVFNLKNKLESINVKCKNIDPEVHSKIKNDHKMLTTEWRKRKRLASQVFDTVLESYSKPKKAFLEEVGIETDEDVNVVMPS